MSLLYGDDYEVDYTFGSDDSTRKVLTYEYAAEYSWGDTFVDIDRLESTDNQRETYSEISPRLSLGKMTDQARGPRLIKDVLSASTVE